MEKQNKDTLLIGTAGYSYDDWTGPFYPQGIKSSGMLEYYSRHFNFTEVNSTYYHMPGINLFKGLDRKTPEGFMFSVKLYKGFTHDRNLSYDEAHMFLNSLSPLTKSGKFLCLLAQFPYSFHFNRENIEYLKTLRQWFDGYKINVEFRNIKWFRGGVTKLLKEENLGFVSIDQPNIKGLPGKAAAVTSEIAYFRFHGRNAKSWYGGKGSERYDYRYSREELMEWVPRINEIKGDSGYTAVSFNNHPVGKAVESARLMREYLKAA